jgi:hypothetical protein
MRSDDPRPQPGAPADSGIFQLPEINPSPLPLPASGARANSFRFCDTLYESRIILSRNLIAHPPQPQAGVSRVKYIWSVTGLVVRSYIRPRKSPGPICRISSRLLA